jgi:hypothetical protein
LNMYNFLLLPFVDYSWQMLALLFNIFSSSIKKNESPHRKNKLWAHTRRAR